MTVRIVGMRKSFILKSLPWIFLILWVLINQKTWHFNRPSHLYNVVGATFGAASFFLFSFSFLYITKWKILESCFGGLDKVFRYHQFLGKIGYSFLLIHISSFSIKWGHGDIPSFFLNLLPIHRSLAINIGSYAFIFMTLILGITVLKLLPYHIWKRLHKWMSVVYILSFIHFLLFERSIGSFASNLLLYTSAAVGLASIVYKQLLYSLFVTPYKCSVAKVEKLNKNLVKITLHSKNEPVRFIPGQYVFVHFDSPNFSKEQHPYTLALDKKSAHILLYVKSRGDYTRALHTSLQTGWDAYLEGPYGRLDFRSDKKQIWIAGGIGIALFLSWIHALKISDKKTIDLFFCCHNRSDLDILNEVRETIHDVQGIRIFTFCSEESQHLNCSNIVKQCPDYRDRKIFMCGPRKLTQSIRKQLLSLSVDRTHIEYEDFNFF